MIMSRAYEGVTGQRAWAQDSSCWSGKVSGVPIASSYADNSLRIRGTE